MRGLAALLLSQFVTLSAPDEKGQIDPRRQTLLSLYDSFFLKLKLKFNCFCF